MQLIYFILIIGTLLLLSCNNNRGKNEISIIKPINDSFLFDSEFKLSHLELFPQDGFVFDTIIINENKPKSELYLIKPRLTRKEDSLIEKTLNGEIAFFTDAFLKDRTGSNDLEYSKLLDSFCINTRPVNIYKTKNFVSYVFEQCYSDNVLMRSYCEYVAVNLNPASNAQLVFSDLFYLKSAKDTLSLKRMIYSALGEKTMSFDNLTLDSKTIFSMDENYIYFFFEPYLFSPFNTTCGIKRKNLKSFIKEGYQ